MKKFLFVILFTNCVASFSQSNLDSLVKKKNAIFIEFFGSSLFLYNLSFDRIFFNKDKFGFSGTIGVQYYNQHNYNYPVISNSIAINLLIGKTNIFETGIGFTYFYDKYSSNFKGFPIRIGYRYQKNSGGFFFKIAITPILTNDKFFSSKKFGYYIFPWAGIAFGYSF